MKRAGIIKEMTPVVIGESQIESQIAFIARAKECSAPILFADQTYHIVNQADNGEMMPMTGSPKTLATGKTLPAGLLRTSSCDTPCPAAIHHREPARR